VILVGAEKLGRRLGERHRIPVEVIPLARGFVARRLKGLGLAPPVRLDRHGPFVTDNGNVILDCAPLEPIAEARAARTLEALVLAIAGVVDTGLFLGAAERVFVGHPDGRVEVLQRARFRDA
jgi:ribose 5-phosphate isomerase A